MTATEDARPYMVSTLAPSRLQKWSAFGFLLVAAAATAVALYLGRVQLPRVDASVPAFAVAMLITDLLTAFLLFAQFSILRSRALIAISSGYLYAGLIPIPWALTFPGIFSTDGLLGAGLQSTAWLYIFWHAGFPSFGIAYALLKHEDPAKGLWHGSVRAAIIWSVLIVTAIVCALTILVTAGESLLLRVAVNPEDLSRVWIIPLACSALITAVAAVLLLLRQNSVLDLWLMVVMLSYLMQSIIAFGSRSRFAVTWYSERAIALVAATLILLVLLYETTTLYAQLLRAALAQRREREARLMTGDAVAASIAHEIKQPLSAMIMNANASRRFLDRPVPDLNEAKSALQRIATDGHRAGEIIDHIRALFRQEARNWTPIDLNGLILECLVLLRGDLQSHRVIVATDCDEPAPRVKGDHVQLQQVLVNLLTNAIDSMAAEDGERLLRIRSGPGDAGTVIVGVEDTGKGIEPSAIDRMFDPLFTTKTHGMGMGLSICRSIIEAHGGRLSASASVPRGAIFQFTLPADGAGTPS